MSSAPLEESTSVLELATYIPQLLTILIFLVGAVLGLAMIKRLGVASGLLLTGGSVLGFLVASCAMWWWRSFPDFAYDMDTSPLALSHISSIVFGFASALSLTLIIASALVGRRSAN